MNEKIRRGDSGEFHAVPVIALSLALERSGRSWASIFL